MTGDVFDDIEALRRAGAAEEAKLPQRKPVKGNRAVLDGPFVMITKDEAAAGFRALDCHMAMVWLEIIYLAWRTKSTTVVLPNKELEAMGVNRWTKKRALCRLVEAKLIRAVQIGKKAPRVTLLRR
jgi:hypothetical protein